MRKLDAKFFFFKRQIYIYIYIYIFERPKNYYYYYFLFIIYIYIYIYMNSVHIDEQCSLRKFSRHFCRLRKISHAAKIPHEKFHRL